VHGHCSFHVSFLSPTATGGASNTKDHPLCTLTILLAPLPPLHVAVEHTVVFLSARIVRFAYGECISQSAWRVYHVPAGMGGPDGAGAGPGAGPTGASGASRAGVSSHARLKWYEFRDVAT
jgi:hypothetical protein